ncbi:hypothetical protein TVAG_113940 [Trichomonas vaginalis G3]|uniref:Wntless-like transmembrane domain-containing protein n=1 Tax=Trichomonas vaginalis (strain ATCC PRA-98 / G3) TaxID=412133 RepID=A2DNP7_TRIV3|nr:transmembrane protein 181 family [Trichomonas vaginalis G3]EAY18050.1 hypothetical protein TVAG_113940 [Trichomonas vaginalis G3]KAI5524384.1 transmembrane protein 181 family [Trichomonas vaginalis G3]|eukprot:XP_001579036.1 hypothetical protein [Trichomonas vaginalis G3]
MENEDDNRMTLIQIEDHLGQEKLMYLDILTKKDLIFCFSMSILIFVLAIIGGILSPQREHEFETSSVFKDNQTKSIFKISNISKWNYFVKAYLSLDLDDSSSNDLIDARFTVSAKSFKNEIQTADEIPSKRIFRQLKLDSQELVTDFAEIFSGLCTDFDTLLIAVKLENKIESCTGITIKWQYGHPHAPLLQFFVRCLLAHQSIRCLIKYLDFLSRSSYRTWHLEQKLTFMLLILCVFAAHPLYILEFFDPSQLGIIFTIFTETLLFSYIKFFIIVLFDSLVHRNCPKGCCFFFKRLFVMITDFIIVFAYNIICSDLLSLDLIPFHITPKVSQILHIGKIIISVFAAILIIISILRATYACDTSERYKFNAYLTTVLIGLGFYILMLLCSRNKKIGRTNFGFILYYAILIFLVNIFSYLHSPYDKTMKTTVRMFSSEQLADQL